MDQTLHIRHGCAQADEDGAADNRVSDVQFFDAFDGGDGGNIVVVERMTGVEAHAAIADQCASAGDLFEFGSQFWTTKVAAPG